MTGREAVAYFVKCHHLGSIKSLCFNYAPSRYFTPYDLVCVHKNHVSTCTFVISYNVFDNTQVAMVTSGKKPLDTFQHIYAQSNICIQTNHICCLFS